MKTRKIGQVARELRISERRIREYERAGLLRVRREPKTNDRLFDDCDVEQIRTIMALIRQRGFSIEALTELIRYAPCWELTDCPLREACPATHNPLVPCYEQRAAGAPMPCEADCERCLIYRSKDLPRRRVAVRPTPRDKQP